MNLLVEAREKTLDQLIDLAICLDNMIRSRKPSRCSTFRSLSPPVMPEQEAMQVGHARISPEERDRRYRQNLCLYCGQAGHVKISSPTRPKQNASSAVSQSFNSSRCVKVPVKLAFNYGVIETMYTQILTSLSKLHFPSSCTRTLIASSPDAHLWVYLRHTHTHSS